MGQGLKAQRLRPKGDWPVVEELPSERAVLITGRHETPGLFALWGGLYVVAAVWLLMALSGGPISLLTLWTYIVTQVVGAWTPADNPRGWLCAVLAVGLPFVYRPFYKPVIIRFFGGNVWVLVERKTIKVRSRGKVYEVPLGGRIQLGVEQHRNAKAEAKRQGTYQRLAPVIWQDAWEVVVRYQVHRITIAEMVWRDEEKAMALVLTINKKIAEVDDMIARMSAKGPPSPKPPPLREAPVLGGYKKPVERPAPEPVAGPVGEEDETVYDKPDEYG